MSRLTILLLLLLGYQTPLAGKARDQSNQTQQLKAHKNQEPQPSPPTIVHQETFNCEPCEQKRQPDTSQAAENPRSAPSWVNPYSTLAIAGLSLLTLVVLWRQFFLIRDIERAWVLVEIGETPVIPPTKIIWLMPKVRNRGSTPARIQKVSIRSRAVPSVQNLPVPPDYAPSINFEFVLAPQVEIRPMRVTFPSAEMQNAGSGQPALCIYGYVEYLDITNKRRTTNFCFAYYDGTPVGDMAGFYPVAEMPAIYNRCT